jgi:23S rRNA (guanosine2251-2'-O)-methyltransferase|tara:strand:+ start:1664 stop:2401 length:738 start_codon:yes stop_codon:yes gene_type:complete
VNDKWVYGFHSVEQQLLKRAVGKLYVREGRGGKRTDSLRQLAESISVEVEFVTDLDDQLGVGVQHQGIAFLGFDAPPEPSRSLETYLQPKPVPRTLLVLDGVTDPGNLGACLRSAMTFGVDAVVVPKHGSAPMNAVVMKRSAGAAGVVPVVEVVNLSRSLRQIKDAGFWVVGTALGAETQLPDFNFSVDTALVMGSEGDGLRFNTRKQCDVLVEIPMQVSEFNLNVSVATGVSLYEIFRQRRQVP